MAKVFKCKDAGVEECAFVARGATEEDVIKMTVEHGQENHPDMMKEMSGKMSESEVKEWIKSKIKEE